MRKSTSLTSQINRHTWVCIAILIVGLFVSVFLLIIPLQNANQAIAHGEVKTATVRSSHITSGGKGSDIQRISYYFKNNNGDILYGETARAAPSNRSEISQWQTGKEINVHYISDENYVVAEGVSNRFGVYAGVASSILPVLLVIISSSHSTLRARDKYEKEVLNPRLEGTVIQFNHKTNRSEVLSENYGIHATPYKTLIGQPKNFLLGLVGTVCLTFAAISALIILSQLTLASPSPEDRITSLALYLVISSTLCLLAGGILQKVCLHEMGEGMDEIVRRRQLIEDHRRELRNDTK